MPRITIPLLLALAGSVSGQNNDTCATPIPLNGMGPWHFESMGATDSGFDDPQCASWGIGNGIDRFYTWTAPCTGTFVFRGVCAGLQVFYALYDGVNCSAVCIDASSPTAVADCFPTGDKAAFVTASAGDTILVQVGLAPLMSAGSFRFVVEPWNTTCPGPTIRTICASQDNHHDGMAATLTESTLGGPNGNNLHLECTQGPAGEFGVFFLGNFGATGSIYAGPACLGGNTGRYSAGAALAFGNPALNGIGMFDTQGVLQNLAGTSTTGSGFDVPMETHHLGFLSLIQPGETLYFQCWYRDRTTAAGATADTLNFSNAIEVTF